MTLRLNDEADTAALGRRIASALRPGDAVLLSGELGAGKTALARAVLRARGVSEPVPSPTFMLAQAYDAAGLPIRHFDLYRIERERDLEELGLDEALDDGAVLVEWPERAPGRFPADALEIALSATGETAREAEIKGPERWRSVLTGAS